MRNLLLIFLCVHILLPVYGTHIRSGEITASRESCSELRLRITITLYTDLGSTTPTGNGFLSFGDGQTLEIPILTPVQLEGYPRVGVAQFTTEHVYRQAGDYLVSYSEPNRNGGIVNMSSSASIRFYVESEIAVYTGDKCNNTPILFVPPVDGACTGKTFIHIPGAVDPDGDSIVYSLVTPKASVNNVVPDYTSPLIWSDLSEDGGPPTFGIDPVSGLITWDSPAQQGEYTIAIRMDEYRRNRFGVEKIGSVTRDMQILVSDCDNNRPNLIPDLDTCIVAGETFQKTLTATDVDGDQVRLELFGELNASDGFMVPDLNSDRSTPAQWQVNWTPECAQVRVQPYELIFKVVDKRIPEDDDFVPLSDFVIWKISVLAPPPEPNDLSLQSNSLLLEWDPYVICDQNQVDSIAVFRAVSGANYVEDICETGIHPNAGYSYLGSTEVGETSFLDDDLIPAARLCYRLVAYLSNGVQSQASREICFDFIPAERPVITHVSVEDTDDSDGEVVIGWREPYDLTSVSRPFSYSIERRTSGTMDFVEVGTVEQAVATPDSLGFRDSGLNTRDSVYFYRIVLTTANSSEQVISEEASTVRLEISPGPEGLGLTWNDDVPWSTYNSGEFHEIFRGDESSQVFLVEVDPLDTGQFYLDSAVEPGRQYCYRVLSKGTYGNPIIPSPFLNYSQVFCAVLGDDLPPGVPMLTITERDCNVAYADPQGVPDRNSLTWTAPVDSDIAFYEVYFKEDPTDSMSLVSQTSETTFTHIFEFTGEGPPSLKGCYRVRAVDVSGNRGPLSNEVCIDNCPNYLLPNVFTPNDDGCNEVFAAYGYKSNSNCGEVNMNDAPRFVNQVDITIYNRWGLPVYTYKGSSENEGGDIFIRWDGTDSSGDQLPSGVYFYTADVRYDLLDPSARNQTIKGWVHLLR